MTMSVPVALPAQATAGKAGSSAPTKGVASAPGQTANRPGADEAAGVADMFAALVAALTAQMQPAVQATPVDTTAVATGDVVEGAVANLFAIVNEAAVAPHGVATTATPEVAVGAAAAAEEGVPAIAGEVTDLDVTDAATTAVPADAATTGGNDADGEQRATPATPATPGPPTDPGTRAERATPATPAAPAQPQLSPQGAALANAATPPAPATKPADVDANVAAIAATPATPAAASTGRAAEVAATHRPAPAADPHVQVARIVRPLRLGDDGTYELALDLTPAELGRVRIDVEMRGGTISLSLRADNPATRQLLQTSLDQLRSELEAAGLHAGHLDVNSSGADSRGAAARHQAESTLLRTAEAPVADTPAPSEPTTASESPAGDTGVDVLA